MPRGPRVLRGRQPPPALIGKMAELAPSPPAARSRVAIVADVRGGVFFGELSTGLEDLREPRHPVPHRVPGGLRRGPGEPVRGDPPPAPAGARRPRGRGHPQGAPDDGVAEGGRRPHHRHLGPVAARAPRPDPRRVQPHGGRTHAAGLDRLVRLQVRRAARLRPGARRPVPAEPALGRLAAPAARHRPEGPGVRDRPAQVRRVHAQAEGAARRHRPRLRRGGQVLPDDRRGLHRRAAPFGRGLRRAGVVLHEEGLRRDRSSIATSTGSDGSTPPGAFAPEGRRPNARMAPRSGDGCEPVQGPTTDDRRRDDGQDRDQRLRTDRPELPAGQPRAPTSRSSPSTTSRTRRRSRTC